MTKCKFCNRNFEARPQVKHPVACNHLLCQKKRQRENEKEWRQRNPNKFRAKYHNTQRKLRTKFLSEVLNQLTRAISIGMKMLNLKMQESTFFNIFKKFFLQLGATRINKFWVGNNINDFK